MLKKFIKKSYTSGDHESVKKCISPYKLIVFLNITSYHFPTEKGLLQSNNPFYKNVTIMIGLDH